MTAELMLFDAKVGEFFSTAYTPVRMRISTLNQLQMRVPPGYPALIRTEDSAFNFFFLDDLTAAASAESRQCF